MPRDLPSHERAARRRELQETAADLLAPRCSETLRLALARPDRIELLRAYVRTAADWEDALIGRTA